MHQLYCGRCAPRDPLCREVWRGGILQKFAKKPLFGGNRGQTKASMRDVRRLPCKPASAQFAVFGRVAMDLSQTEKGAASAGSAAEVPPRHQGYGGTFDARLAARYDAAAPRWHRRMQRLGYPRAYACLFAWLRDAGWFESMSRGGRVLDCGIGTGVATLALAEVMPVREAVGVDIAPGMLREAQANLAAAGICPRMQRADAHLLMLPDACFDAALSAHMLEHVSSPRQAIAELARVLRPGAPLLIIAARGGLADRLIRLKWRHVPIADEQLIAWMSAARVANIAAFDVGDALSPARWLSRAFVGRKS
jgi:demethylmenaquinone methyltransferase/2-methoxy-6-polyprenyl-1,4-benzoquinol methylase